MQHAQHKENDFLATGCVRIRREKKKIEEERKKGRKRQPTLREKQREKCNCIIPQPTRQQMKKGKLQVSTNEEGKNTRANK